jgi:hypothetical protein
VNVMKRTMLDTKCIWQCIILLTSLFSLMKLAVTESHQLRPMGGLLVQGKPADVNSLYKAKSEDSHPCENQDFYSYPF